MLCVAVFWHWLYYLKWDLWMLCLCSACLLRLLSLAVWMLLALLKALIL